MRTKEQEKLRPNKWPAIILFISGFTLWIRVPYNLIKGLSFSECIKNEKYDLWNVGLHYRR